MTLYVLLTLSIILIMATLQEFKNSLGIQSLPLIKSVDEQGKETGFLTAWLDDIRTRVVIHNDVVAKIQANPKQFIATKYSEKSSKESGEAYMQYIVIIPKAEPDVIL
jgi:hypothetical protein